MKPGRRGDGVGGREVFRDLIQKDLEKMRRRGRERACEKEKERGRGSTEK